MKFSDALGGKALQSATKQGERIVKNLQELSQTQREMTEAFNENAKMIAANFVEVDTRLKTIEKKLGIENE